MGFPSSEQRMSRNARGHRENAWRQQAATGRRRVSCLRQSPRAPPYLALLRNVWGSRSPRIFGIHRVRSAVPHTGSSEILVDRATVQLAPHQSSILSRGATTKVTHSHDLEHFVLKIDREALLNKWAALTGRQPPRDLKFEPVADSR